jgi:hypothetical protein
MQNLSHPNAAAHRQSIQRETIARQDQEVGQLVTRLRHALSTAGHLSTDIAEYANQALATASAPLASGLSLDEIVLHGAAVITRLSTSLAEIAAAVK